MRTALVAIVCACYLLGSADVLAEAEEEGFSGALSSFGFFSMVGASYEEEERASAELGEAMKVEAGEDEHQLKQELQQGVKAEQAASAMDAKASAWVAKATSAMRTAKGFQLRAKNARRAAAQLRNAAAARIKQAKTAPMAKPTKQQRSLLQLQGSVIDNAEVVDLNQDEAGGRPMQAAVAAPVAGGGTSSGAAAGGSHHGRHQEDSHHGSHQHSSMAGMGAAKVPRQFGGSNYRKMPQMALKTFVHQAKKQQAQAMNVQEMKNKLVKTLIAAFTRILYEPTPACPIRVQEVALNTTNSSESEESGGAPEEEELGESHDNPCAKDKRPIGQSRKECMRKKCWSSYASEIRAAAGENGPYKAANQTVHPNRSCANDCKVGNKPKCSLQLKAVEKKDSDNCMCSSAAVERKYGFNLEADEEESGDLLSLGESHNTPMHTYMTSSMTEANVVSGPMGPMGAGKPKFPVESSCEMKYEWPSYRYVPNATLHQANVSNANASNGSLSAITSLLDANSSVIVPVFGDCSCVATKRAVCKFQKPSEGSTDPPFKCDIKKFLLGCEGGKRNVKHCSKDTNGDGEVKGAELVECHESTGLNKTQAGKFAGRWCEAGFSGL